MNKYTCNLSATERAKLFVELYGELSKNLTRVHFINYKTVEKNEWDKTLIDRLQKYRKLKIY